MRTYKSIKNGWFLLLVLAIGFFRGLRLGSNSNEHFARTSAKSSQNVALFLVEGAFVANTNIHVKRREGSDGLRSDPDVALSRTKSHNFCLHCFSIQHNQRLTREKRRATSYHPITRVTPSTNHQILALKKNRKNNAHRSSTNLHAATSSSSSSPSMNDETTSSNEATNNNNDEEDFQRRSKIHRVLQGLKQQIPKLLKEPLEEITASEIYDKDVLLVVEKETNKKNDGDDNMVVLASSRDELTNLSTTLVLAVVASQRANSFLMEAVTSFGGGGGRSTRSTTSDASNANRSGSTELESIMILDPSLTSVLVKWDVRLPGVLEQPSTSSSKIENRQRNHLEGITKLLFDPSNGKVKQMQLCQVKFNNQLLNAGSIGENLANFRRLAMNVQDNPLTKSFLQQQQQQSSSASTTLPFFPNALNTLLGPNWMQELTATTTSSSSGSSTTTTPLYVSPDLFSETDYDKALLWDDIVTSTNATTVQNVHNRTKRSDTPNGQQEKRARQKMIPINDYNDNINGTIAVLPLPGSIDWIRYETSKRLYDTFVKETLPILSGSKTIPSHEMITLFSSSAKLETLDGTTLVKGRDPVMNFFHTLSSWRKRSKSSWKLVNASLLEWKGNQNNITIEITYEETFNLPGSTVPFVVKGCDQFVLEYPKERLEGEEVDFDAPPINILLVKQTKLDIITPSSSTAAAVAPITTDGTWFMTNLIKALDTGKFSSVGGDSFMMELFQRAIAGGGSDTSTTLMKENNIKRGTIPSSKQRRKVRQSPNVVSTDIGFTIYKMMMQLHREAVPETLLLDGRNVVLPLLGDYMNNDAIELRGYLGETIARGKVSYERIVRATLTSLRAAISTGAIQIVDDEDDDETRSNNPVIVELTSEGNIRLKTVFKFKILPLVPAAGGALAADLIKTLSQNKITIPDVGSVAGGGLKVEVVSEYIIDYASSSSSNLIYQHRLIETKINDRLTPGDVVAGWLKGQVRGGSGLDTSNANPQRFVLDLLSWLSKQQSNK